MGTGKRAIPAVLLAILGSCVAATSQPANARDGAWYVGGDFGGLIVEDPGFNVTPTIPAGASSSFSLNHDYGYDAALFVGYDLGAFRIEAEVAYKRARVEDIEAVARVPAGGGQTSALSFMVNGMIDLPAVQGFTFSGGMGIGAALVELRDYRHVGATGPFIDTSDFSFAIQAIASVRKPITDNVDIHFKYRFFSVPNLAIDSVAREHITTSFTSQSALIGLTYNFGAPPPPPP